MFLSYFNAFIPIILPIILVVVLFFLFSRLINSSLSFWLTSFLFSTKKRVFLSILFLMSLYVAVIIGMELKLENSTWGLFLLLLPLILFQRIYVYSKSWYIAESHQWVMLSYLTGIILGLMGLEAFFTDGLFFFVNIWTGLISISFIACIGFAVGIKLRYFRLKRLKKDIQEGYSWSKFIGL